MARLASIPAGLCIGLPHHYRSRIGWLGPLTEPHNSKKGIPYFYINYEAFAREINKYWSNGSARQRSVGLTSCDYYQILEICVHLLNDWLDLVDFHNWSTFLLAAIKERKCDLDCGQVGWNYAIRTEFHIRCLIALWTSRILFDFILFWKLDTNIDRIWKSNIFLFRFYLKRKLMNLKYVYIQYKNSYDDFVWSKNKIFPDWTIEKYIYQYMCSRDEEV